MRGAMLLRLWLGGVLMLFSVAALADNAVTTDVASVRAGPDDSYPEVAQLDPDSPIQVMGCLDDWSWCDVAFGEDRGWLYAPDISYDYEGGYVPFYAYAPAFGLPVVTFSLDAYWGSHYQNRPWYGHRDEWVHRTIHHQRPSGPAPSHALPPREVVRAEKLHGRSRPGEPPMRLSEAERGHRDEDRAVPGRAPDVGRSPEKRSSPETRPQERSVPPAEHTAPPRQEEQHQRAEREPRAPERAAPQREQEHPHSVERPAGAGPQREAPHGQREEQHGAPAKPEAAPRKDEGDHRG